jgi:hypothetical protein
MAEVNKRPVVIRDLIENVCNWFMTAVRHWSFEG